MPRRQLKSKLRKLEKKPANSDQTSKKELKMPKRKLINKPKKLERQPASFTNRQARL